MRQLREEDGVTSDDDDESKWEGWDVETDSSESSDDEDWIDVDSDSDKHIVVSDSEDEDNEKEKDPPFVAQPVQPPQPSTLATTKVKINPTNFDADC
jgi:protein SDA1